MARQMVETQVDDLDGSPAAETVSFGLDGQTYELDLSKRNAAALRRALDRYIGAAQGGGGKKPRGSRARGTSDGSRGYDIAQLREWAGANQIQVPARGRIPQTVVEQFMGSKRTQRRKS
jgi:Lsr2